MGDLDKLRNELSTVDDQILDLFIQRMNFVSEIGAHKRNTQGVVFVPQQERKKIQETKGKVGPELELYAEGLMQTLLRLSRERQYELIVDQDQSWSLRRKMLQARKKKAPQVTTVAMVLECQSEDLVNALYPDAQVLKVADAEVACSQVVKGAAEVALIPEVEIISKYFAEHSLFVLGRFFVQDEQSLFAVVPQFILVGHAKRVSLLVQLGSGKADLDLVVNLFEDFQIPITKLSFEDDHLYIEFEAAPENKRALRALYQLEQETFEMQILGWYPCYHVSG